MVSCCGCRGCRRGRAQHARAYAVRYQTEPVQRGSLTVTVTATGAVQSLTEVKVGTEISGIVETVNVDFNSRVTAWTGIGESQYRQDASASAAGESSP